MSKPLITLVAGARPNFMKIAPIGRALDRYEHKLRYEILHTGQHYDQAMSDVFFEDLGIRKPEIYLNAGGGSHAEQTAKIMVGFEKYCRDRKPDLVLVVGDVNSTLACAIVAKKLHIKVAHVEAGLRSGDRQMPEEINRLVTDSISDIFYVTERSAERNLEVEGKDLESVKFVGHVMVDNLFYQLNKLDSHNFDQSETAKLKKRIGEYCVLTLHRPSNVDDPLILSRLMSVFNELSEKIALVFPVHPRTKNQIDELRIETGDKLYLLEPLPYMEFLNLWKDAKFVLTDSGGLQEETTALRVPCVTIRENTERPITVEVGSNQLVGTHPGRILEATRELLNDNRPAYNIPELWDGHSAERIAADIANELGV